LLSRGNQRAIFKYGEVDRLCSLLFKDVFVHFRSAGLAILLLAFFRSSLRIIKANKLGDVIDGWARSGQLKVLDSCGFVSDTDNLTG
jgi:hypothetical protein